MIGMIAYAILGGFILIAVFIGNRLVKIFGWSLSPNKLFLLRAGVFFGIFFILFFRDIVGAIQFEYLCHRKINVKLEPNWQSVRRASVTEKRRKQYGYFIPTFCTDVEYYDMDTEKYFFLILFVKIIPASLRMQHHWAMILEVFVFQRMRKISLLWLVLKIFYRKEIHNEQHFFLPILMHCLLMLHMLICQEGEINMDAGIYKILSRRMTPQLAKFIADEFWIVNSGCPDSCER